MIDILTDYEEMSERNRKGLGSFTKCLPSLKRLIIKSLDIGEELTLFPIENSPGAESQMDTIGANESQNVEVEEKKRTFTTQMSMVDNLSKNRKRMRTLPSKEEEENLKKEKDSYGWMYKYIGKKQKIGYENIIAEARSILLKSNESKIKQEIAA